MDLRDVRCVVTGAGGGMGAHFARRLAEAGARVAAGDINEAGLAALPADIERRRLDVTDAADRASFTRWAADRLGGVNALINNAGIVRDGLLVKRSSSSGVISTLSLDDWNAVLAVNLTGATMMVQETARQMLEREVRPGVIVNIASVSRHGNRGQSNYAASKAALAANTVTWARELAPHGIRVTCVAPGFTASPMTSGMRQEVLDRAVQRILVGRMGAPEDIWQAVRFALVCDYFNAATVDVDGGR